MFKKKIKLVSNPKKKWAERYASELSSILSEKFSVVESGADATVCIGGDGTIFHAYHSGLVEGPILGVGSDTSFVCQVREGEEDKVVSILEKWNLEKRISLSASSGDMSWRCINDTVLHTVDYRVIKLNVDFSGCSYVFEGDGVIISTPLGSTAYSYSAGGTVIERGAKVIEIVPICPYKRLFCPHILDESTEISLFSDREADLIIDGIYVKRLSPGEKVTVKKSGFVEFFVE